jgi:transposase
VVKPLAYVRRRGRFDKQCYRLRARVAQLMNRLKQFRRVATRSAQRAANNWGMVTIATIVYFAPSSAP